MASRIRPQASEVLAACRRRFLDDMSARPGYMSRRLAANLSQLTSEEVPPTFDEPSIRLPLHTAMSWDVMPSFTRAIPDNSDLRFPKHGSDVRSMSRAFGN
jgi:hypothetical protein